MAAAPLSAALCGRQSAMSKLAALTIILALLQGCASTEQTRNNIERDISEMYSTHYSAEIQHFFVEEAINAGVREIRAMKSSDKRPASNKNEIINCARVNLHSKSVLIEVNRPLCLMPAHLAHEIAHIGSNCGDHDEVFYRYNFKIAKRYEERFPNAATRQWFAPVQSVANVKAIYTNGAC